MDGSTLTWAAAIGQTAFVIIWAQMPFWRTWIGVALMTKSVFLCLILWFWVSGLYFPYYDYRDLIRQVLMYGVAVGIWLQVIALTHEIHRSRSRRNHAAAKS